MLLSRTIGRPFEHYGRTNTITPIRTLCPISHNVTFRSSYIIPDARINVKWYPFIASNLPLTIYNVTLFYIQLIMRYWHISKDLSFSPPFWLSQNASQNNTLYFKHTSAYLRPYALKTKNRLLIKLKFLRACCKWLVLTLKTYES